ncbi:hypothetical protein DL240_05825 [Lujinxingia litoralis]|uniref:Putative 2-succinyl-6-hydroxy-2,4-cyclohexadiene-1-carboxylate synthase n=1 Tax=Lujinxingia litoralis TaxID=2211119 RepID=A0A328CBZ8_9DELT|nr:alpha/beta fold hydrolase [Lujinxingia litoralis]RAL23677.1 hypothetical protein DL240_05825 [Lujinxingia litoralis]
MKGRLQVREQGEGPVALFVHGFMGDGRDWEEVIAGCRDVRRCVAVDLPGHGGSVGALGEEPMTLGAMAEQVAAVVAEVSSEPVDVVGYSMGGRVALALALAYPERVRTVVLESASPGLEGEGARKVRAELDRERAARLRGVGVRGFVAEWYELALFESLRAHPGFEAMKGRRLEGDAEALARVIAEVSPGLEPERWSELPGLGVPSLWIAGASDARYASMAARAAGASGGEARVIGGAGHNVHLEEPRGVVEALRVFWRSAGG